MACENCTYTAGVLTNARAERDQYRHLLDQARKQLVAAGIEPVTTVPHPPEQIDYSALDSPEMKSYTGYDLIGNYGKNLLSYKVAYMDGPYKGKMELLSAEMVAKGKVTVAVIKNSAVLGEWPLMSTPEYAKTTYKLVKVANKDVVEAWVDDEPPF